MQNCKKKLILQPYLKRPYVKLLYVSPINFVYVWISNVKNLQRIQQSLLALFMVLASKGSSKIQDIGGKWVNVLQNLLYLFYT